MDRTSEARVERRASRGRGRTGRAIRNVRTNGPAPDPNQLALVFEGAPAKQASVPEARREWLAEAARALLIVGVILGGLLL